MEKKHAKRLLKLADFLEALPKKLFNYSVVCEQAECGTVGCAIGWASVLPFARREGYSVREIKDEYGSYLRLEKNGVGQSYVRAGQDLFGLSEYQSSILFTPSDSYGPGYDATPKQVAKFIRKFVEDRRSIPSPDFFE